MGERGGVENENASMGERGDEAGAWYRHGGEREARCPGRGGLVVKREGVNGRACREIEMELIFWLAATSRLTRFRWGLSTVAGSRRRSVARRAEWGGGRGFWWRGRRGRRGE